MRFKPTFLLLLFICSITTIAATSIMTYWMLMSSSAAVQPHNAPARVAMKPTSTQVPRMEPTAVPITPRYERVPLHRSAVPDPAATPTAASGTAPTASFPQPEPAPTGFGGMRYPQGSLVHGHGLVIHGKLAYTVDAGRLRAAPLEPGGAVRTLAPPGGIVDGVPIKDWIDVADGPDGTLWLLDRMGDLVRYNPHTDMWTLVRPIVDRFHDPSQLYIALDSFGQRAYILDESQGQIWRWPTAGAEEGYFGGVDVWQRIEQGIDITRAVDVAVDGSVYLLLREEPEPRKQLPARIRRYDGMQRTWEIREGAAFERPLQVFAPDGNTYLYVIDQDGMRVQVLDKTSGAVVRSHSFDSEVRAIAQQGERLYFLGRDAIYWTPGSETAVITAADPGPDWRPDDPQRWSGIKLRSPIPHAFLPDRDSLIPGAPRLYRFGVHEGIDFFGIAVGTPIEIGTPVLAAADGVIVRADTDYVEMSPAELDHLLTDAARQRNTPSETEDHLRGREIWIDHGKGLVTRYSHLHGIAPDIDVGTVVTAGQPIGYAGNSGVEAGVNGTNAGVHLHFEIRLGDQYLGRWMSPLETRRILAQLFDLPR